MPYPKCGKEFKDTKNPFKQYSSHVNGCGSIKCPTCEKVFMHAKLLRVHAVKHTQEFMCATCHKCFESKSKLSRHTNTHTKLLSFPCGDCDKTFTRKEHLNKHRNQKHVV